MIKPILNLNNLLFRELGEFIIIIPIVVINPIINITIITIINPIINITIAIIIDNINSGKSLLYYSITNLAVNFIAVIVIMDFIRVGIVVRVPLIEKVT